MEALSKKSTVYLTHLKQVVTKALSKIPYNLTDMRYLTGQPKYPEQFSWLAPNMQSLLRSLRQWITFECTANVGRQIHFHLSSPHKDTPQLRKKLYDRVQQCCAWLVMADAYAPARCSTSMHIYMYFTDAKKMLPNKKGDVIDIEHANTAFTTSCSTNTSIIIFREEEWFKVFIHETFHNLGLDFSSQNINNLQKSLAQHFKIRSEMRVYETYCETWANLLNVLFTQNNWQMALENERRHSLLQAAKVFKHFNMSFNDLKTTKATDNFNENTEVFCYFILRSLWMWNLNRFLEWCLTNNNGSLQFTGSVNEFVRHMVINISVSSDYIAAVAPENATNNKSLRMTLYG